MTSTPTNNDEAALDDLLRGSDPLSSLPLRAEALAGSVARAPMRRNRRRPTFAAGGLVLAGVLGMGSAAVAGVGPFASIVSTPNGENVVARSDLDATNGDNCAMKWVVIPEAGVPADDPAVIAATNYLANLDYDSIDTKAMIAKVKKDAKESVDPATGSKTGFVWSETLYESTALAYQVFEMAQAELRSQGLDPAKVSFETPTNCPPPTFAPAQ